VAGTQQEKERERTMATYSVEFACGHTKYVTLYGPMKDRRRRLEWLQTQQCYECCPPPRPKPDARLKKQGDGTYRIEIRGAYPIKEYLKEVGYRWDRYAEAWYRPVNPRDPAELVAAWAAIREHVEPDPDLLGVEVAWDTDQVREYRAAAGVA